MRILIVDDHPVVISGCKALLAGEADVEIFEAGDADAGYEAFLSHSPDIALIDINLPGVSGFDLTHRILRQAPESRIVIFSMNDDPAFVGRALDMGAKGFIAKNDDPMLFVSALRQVYAGGTYLAPGLAHKMVFARSNNPLSHLSARELEIVHLLAAGDDIPAIAEKLGVAGKTIANNCTVLKGKLGAKNSMDLVRAAMEALSR